MKKIVRLTENDLHKIIKESVKKILKEGYGDWRDDYDAWMDGPMDDKKAGEQARLRYIAAANRDFGGDPSSNVFNGDKKRFQNALERHQTLRDMTNPYRGFMKTQTPS